MSRRMASWGLLTAAVLLGTAAVALPRLWPGLLPAWAGSVMFVFALVFAFAAVLRGQLPDGCDTASPGLRRRYTRELFLSMGAYTLVLFASVWLLRHIEAPALRVLVALLPVPPIAFALRAIVRYIRDSDEMQQRIELEAVCIATGMVSLLYLAGGFLQVAKIIDVPAGAVLIWLFPLICLTYGLVKVVVARRYR